MGKKLYIRNFPANADDKILKRKFGRKKIEKIDIIEKKDDSGEVISRFCYLYVHFEEQAAAIVKKWNGIEWEPGTKLDIKIARESFMERAKKLQTPTVPKTVADKDKPFVPLFQTKTFEASSSSEDSDSEVETPEDKPKERKKNLESSSARLHEQIKAKKNSEIRRLQATEDRQERYLQQKNSKFCGKKITFSDSDDEDEKPRRELFGSDDEVSDNEVDWSNKIRPEHEGEIGGEIHRQEMKFGGDSRFQMGENFKDDVAKTTDVKPKRKRNMFDADRRYIPNNESEDEEVSLNKKINELKKEKEKFTNVQAPEVSTEAYFNVESDMPIARVNTNRASIIIY